MMVTRLSFAGGAVFSPCGDNAFIVYEHDGAPLADDEERITLIGVTDVRPVRHVRWLKALTLRAA
jgi:hypothetical protein